MAVSPTSIQISAAHAKSLERRGGRSHRGRGAFNRSLVFGRVLDSHRLYVEFTDPRQTRGMPEEVHALVIRLLPEPWALKRFEILKLESVLDLTPASAPAATAPPLKPPPPLPP